MGPSCNPGCECRKHSPTAERNAKISASLRGQKRTPEQRQRISEAHLGIPNVNKGTGRGFFIERGYRMLTGQMGHPLLEGLARYDVLGEHRKVLYDKIGPGEHQCYWCSKPLKWGGVDGIIADHVDQDKLNNDPANLVPSCLVCNWHRKAS